MKINRVHSLAILGLFLLTSGPSMGQNPEMGDVGVSPGTDFQPGAALIEPDPFQPVLQPYFDVRDKLADDYGLNFEAAFTLFSQIATDVDAGPQGLTTGSYDLIFDWTLIQPEEDGFLATGLAIMLIEGGLIIGNDEDEDLSAGVGSILGVNDDLDTRQFQISELLWSQGFFSDRVIFSIGKIDQTVWIDANRVANDETIQFISTPLVNNPAIPFPENGLGFNLNAAPTPWLWLSLGVSDGIGDQAGTGFNTLREGQLFIAGEASFEPKLDQWFDGDAQGNYRFIGWTARPDGAEAYGSGVAVSFDQAIGHGLVPFFRYGYAERAASDLRHFVSAGIGLEQPLGRADDLVAVGVAWADPYDPDLRQETLLEAFYRLQLTDTIAVTPDLQIIFRPGASNGLDVVALFGLRVQATF